MRTLIVEDERLSRRALETALRTRDHEVTACSTAEEALEAHCSAPFELLVIDWVLPGMDGLELCRRVRAMPGGDAPIVIVATARTRPADVATVLDAGASDYVSKPVVPALLETRLMIAEHHAARDARRRREEAALRDREAAVQRTALAESTSRHDAVIENTRDAIWSVDAAYCFVSMNTAFRAEHVRTFGRRPRVGELPWLGAPPDFVAAWRPHYARALAGEAFAVEMRDGAGEWASDREVSFNPILGDGGAVSGAAVFSRDITARKRADLALRASEANLSALLENTNESIWSVDLEGHLIASNKVFREEFFRARGEPVEIGSRLDVGVPEAMATLWRPLFLRAFAGERLTVERSYPLGGTTRHFLISVGPIESGGRVTGAVAFKKDVTDLRHMELRLLLADRMASVGRLAAGVAHEINTPLAYVIANLEYLAEEGRAVTEALGGTAAREVSAAVREAKVGAERVRAIVRDLKTFSRGEEHPRGDVDVRRVLDSTVAMAWNEIRHRARLVKHYNDVPPAAANEARLAQVFLNLLLNAAQSIPEGAVSANEIRVSTQLEAGDRIVVEIADSGAGIPADLLPHVFDPFFTTKPVGVGTGLGLSICHGIVTDLGGDITVRSTVGQGTTFRVSLPTERRPRAQRSADGSQPPLASARSTRVLVVDDDALVAHSLRRALRGHQVAIASGGREGLTLLASKDFDLILCDLMMPDLSGMEFYGAASSHNASVAAKIVFMTGGAFTPGAREFLASVPNQWVQKPFDMTALRTLVSQYARPAE